MSSHEGNQYPDHAPVLHIETATSEATVTAAVAAVMAYFNANDINEVGSSVGNFNRNNNQGNQRRTTHPCTQKPKPKNKRRKFGNEKGDSLTQRLTKRQQAGPIPTLTNPTPPTPRQSYLGSNPPCNKCKYHH